MFHRFTSVWVIGLLLLHIPVESAPHFERNKNSAPELQTYDPFDRIPAVKYLAKANEYTTYFTPGGMILAGFAPERQQVTATVPQYFELSILLRNALPDVEISTLNPRLARSDFFGSPAPSWLTDLPHYAKVKYTNVYPDVDLVFQMDHRQLDMQFVIAPGGDPGKIRFEIRGAESIVVTPEGALLVTVNRVTFEIPKPEGYQAVDNSSARNVVDARYTLAGKNQVGLQLAPYDPKRTLIIQR